MKKTRNILLATLLVLVIHILTASPATAAKLAVAVNQSRVLSFDGVERVAVANPEIADVIAASGSEVLAVGKAAGITSLYIWSGAGRSDYEVEVGIDSTKDAAEIKDAIGYPDIKVRKVGQTIVLEGSVADQYQKNRAEKVANVYGKVLNLLEMNRPIQIKIEAKLIEIDRQKTKELGLKWGNSPGYAAGEFSLGQSFSNPNGGGKPLGKLGGYSAINAQLSALLQNGSAKILSQPYMITLSGEKASIMVGGQIPIPVSVQGNQIGIEWKDYGIKLEILPEVAANGLINSKVKAEVSALDWNSPYQIELGPSMYIPPLKMRKAETALAIDSGQTMVIGGLLSNEITKDVYKVPLLADLPILGGLFKSTAFNNNQTELLIFITPTVVDNAENSLQAKTKLKDFITTNP